MLYAHRVQTSRQAGAPTGAEDAQGWTPQEPGAATAEIRQIGGQMALSGWMPYIGEDDDAA